MRLYRKPLFLTSDGVAGDTAFARAAQVAREAGAELTVLDVGEPMPAETSALFSAEALQRLLAGVAARRGEALQALAAKAARSGVTVNVEQRVGSPFQVAIRAVLDEGYDVLIKAIEGGESGRRATQSSVDRHLLRKCPCPVWLVAEGARADAALPVLAAVNPDPDEAEHLALSREILRTAAAAAALEGAPLHVLHAWHVFGELLLQGPEPLVSDPEVDFVVGRALNRHARYLEDLVASVPLGAVEPTSHLVHARPADAIVDFVTSNSVGLLVLGSVGRTGIPGLFIGNTAERVLNEVTCSVLALKPRGFVSPVATHTPTPAGAEGTSC